MTNGTNGNGTNQCGGVILLDPVQGLVDYINDIKPYHTKIIDVLIDYVYEEAVDVTIVEDPQWDMFFVRPPTPPAIGSPLQVPVECTPESPFLSTRVWDIQSPNTTIDFESYPAMETNVFRTLGDRRPDIVVGAQIEMTTAIEDRRYMYDIIGFADVGSPATPYTRSFVIDDSGSPSFASVFDVFALGSPAGNYDLQTEGLPLDDGRVLTIKSITPGGSPGQTIVDVYDAVLSTSVGSPLPQLGLVRTVLPNQSGVRTVLSVEYDGGSIDSWPGWPDPLTYQVGDDAHTRIRVSGASLTLPSGSPSALQPGQNYVSTFQLRPLNLTGVLSYSNTVRHVVQSPLSVSQTPDEGTNILPVLGAVASTPVGSPPTSWLPDGEFVVGRDFAASNLFVGDILQVSQSFDNNGTFHIAEIRPADPLPDQTTLRVVERVRSDVADGQILFDLPSNVFFLDGNHITRFVQGKKFDVINGTFGGTYTTLSSDFLDGQTRIRVLENIIPHFVGSAIASISGSPEGFVVFGDHTAAFTTGQKFNVVGSTANDGEYEVASSAYNVALKQTLIVPTSTDTLFGTDRSGNIVLAEHGQIVDAALTVTEPELCVLVDGTEALARTVIAEELVFVWTEVPIDVTELDRWEISGLEFSASTVYVTGDITSKLAIDDDVLITESILGGWYEVADITYNGGQNRTEIETRPTLPVEIVGSPIDGYGYIERRNISETGWFQFMITRVIAPSTVEVIGDARQLLSKAQPFRIIGGTPNDGVWEVANPVSYNPATETSTIPVIGTLLPFVGSPNNVAGFVEAYRFTGGIHIHLQDQIGVGVTETTAATGGALVIESGHMVDPWDYGYWDLGTFDERLGTVLYLYNNTP